MQIDSIKRSNKNKTAKRIGRGGSRGKTSGRGHKGQKARAGNSMRPETRDFIKRLPKLRGHGVNRSRTVVHKLANVVINVAALEAAFPKGGEVNPRILRDMGLISTRKGQHETVKILGHGDLKQKLTVSGCVVSASARAKIESAGGTIAE